MARLPSRFAWQPGSCPGGAGCSGRFPPEPYPSSTGVVSAKQGGCGQEKLPPGAVDLANRRLEALRDGEAVYKGISRELQTSQFACWKEGPGLRPFG